MVVILRWLFKTVAFHENIQKTRVMLTACCISNAKFNEVYLFSSFLFHAQIILKINVSYRIKCVRESAEIYFGPKNEEIKGNDDTKAEGTPE